MSDKSLIIWLKNGQTLKFEQVEKFTETEDGLIFKYFGISTQVKRTAVFHRINIAGYAIED